MMKHMRRMLIAAAAIALVVGCAASSGEKKKIGVVVPALANQFWANYLKFVEQGAKELDIDLIALNANDKPDNMVKGLEDLVAQNVDGIIFTPYWETASRGLTLAKEAGIPVVLTDSFPEYPPQTPRFPNYIAFIGPSDEDAGYRMGRVLYEAMKPDAKGKKVIGVVNGTAGTSVAIGRRKGLESFLKEHPDMVIAGEIDSNFLRDVALSKFESLYQGNPDITGVWCANDESATGVITAIRNAGKTPGSDILVVGMDLDAHNVGLVKSGEQLFDLGGHWLQGGFALVTLYDYLNGHPVPSDKAEIKLKLLPLTKELVPQFEKDFPGGMPAYDFKARSKTYNPKAETAAFEMTYSK